MKRGGTKLGVYRGRERGGLGVDLRLRLTWHRQRTINRLSANIRRVGRRGVRPQTGCRGARRLVGGCRIRHNDGSCHGEQTASVDGGRTQPTTGQVRLEV